MILEKLFNLITIPLLMVYGAFNISQIMYLWRKDRQEKFEFGWRIMMVIAVVISIFFFGMHLEVHSC